MEKMAKIEWEEIQLCVHAGNIILPAMMEWSVNLNRITYLIHYSCSMFPSLQCSDDIMKHELFSMKDDITFNLQTEANILCQ